MYGDNTAGQDSLPPVEKNDQRRLRKQFNLAEQAYDNTRYTDGHIMEENEDEHPFFRDHRILSKVNKHLKVQNRHSVRTH